MHVCPGAKVKTMQEPAQPAKLVPIKPPVFFFSPPPPPVVHSSVVSLLFSYLCHPADAKPFVLYSHLNSGLNRRWALAPGSNRPICAVCQTVSYYSLNDAYPSAVFASMLKHTLRKIKTKLSTQHSANLLFSTYLTKILHIKDKYI